MEPALPALLRGTTVPGDAQGQQASVRKFDQILLQRIPAKGIGNPVFVQLSISIVGTDVVASIIA